MSLSKSPKKAIKDLNLGNRQTLIALGVASPGLATGVVLNVLSAPLALLAESQT
jgi:hypothetical protein